MSLVDAEGERLHSVRMGRMPESHKATLKTMVAAEVEAVLGPRPDLTVVKLADGAKDNWTFLTATLPEGVELIDFYHAVEHLKDAFDSAHGADSPTAAAQFNKYRHRLRHEPDGVHRVIRALVYLRSKSPGQRANRTGAGLLPRQSPSHGVRRCQGPGTAHWLPASWRRHARPWSPSDSSVPACDGARAAGKLF